MDIEEALPRKSVKHGIESYANPDKSPGGTSDESGEYERPSLAHGPTVLQTVARSSQVEAKKKTVKLTAEHFVRIFSDDDEYIEVSPEQVDRVKMMHEKIESGINFSFNFNTLLLVSSVLAALGLVSDSPATVVASMLVSPIMGPVVGLAYGTTINDWKLVRLALRNECICLLFCIIVGAIVASITGVTALADEWITSEMQSRADVNGFIVAMPVAFFSGLGVAVSLFDSQTASLVGVAISASLLPPAVNAGVLWIYFAYLRGGIIEQPEDPVDDEERFAYGGLLSLALTVANIVLIWISSMLMFRLKEVLPIEKNVFWDDIGVARKIYQKRALLEVVDVSDEEEGRGAAADSQVGEGEGSADSQV